MPGDKQGGLTRRDLLKRSAAVGGTLVWAAPAVQTFARPAFAQQASPDATVGVLTYVERKGEPRVCYVTTYAVTEDCYDCVAEQLELHQDAIAANYYCGYIANRCRFDTPISVQSC